MKIENDYKFVINSIIISLFLQSLILYGGVTYVFLLMDITAFLMYGLMGTFIFLIESNADHDEKMEMMRMFFLGGVIINIVIFIMFGILFYY